MTPPAKSRTTTDSRLTKMESSLENLGVALNSFVNESREYRSYQNAERDKMWTAIQQADRSRAITWPMIFTAITVFMALIAAAAKIAYTFTEMRAAQIEEKVSHAREIDQLRDAELRRMMDRPESR